MRRSAAAGAAGLLVAASVPPLGWWPLALVGLALLERSVRWASRRRAVAGAAFVFGLCTYLPSLWWITGFSLPGAMVVVALQAAVTGAGITVATARTAPGSARRAVGIAVGVTVAELARSRWPFGGLPLGGIDLGQADGPIAPVATWGGRMLVVLVTAALGVALGCALARGRRGTPVAGARVVLVALVACTALAHVGPTGSHDGPPLRVAVVQGGGPRGERASEEAAARTFLAHRLASRRLEAPVDLVLWPEDVIDVDRFAGSSEERVVLAEARRIGAPVVVGVVEDGSPGRFRNAAVVVAPDGTTGADPSDGSGRRFDKVHRVPYGEYFPFRSTIERFGLADLPARDAEPGTGPGLVRTSVGTFAVAISFEAFFPDRARSGVRAGGSLLLVPTNASSYRTSHVPTQQIAAARLRARETGRWVVQAAPTGFSAVVTPDGAVVARTDLGARAVLRSTVRLRSGLTPAARLGDRPVVAATGAALLVLLVGSRRGSRVPRGASRATARLRR